jgi:hypothetical protein
MPVSLNCVVTLGDLQVSNANLLLGFWESMKQMFQPVAARLEHPVVRFDNLEKNAVTQEQLKEAMRLQNVQRISSSSPAADLDP